MKPPKLWSVPSVDLQNISKAAADLFSLPAKYLDFSRFVASFLNFSFVASQRKSSQLNESKDDKEQ